MTADQDDARNGRRDGAVEFGGAVIAAGRSLSKEDAPWLSGRGVPFRVRKTLSPVENSG